jgi:Zn-dependent M28 family amino/carboxypeptidase
VEQIRIPSIFISHSTGQKLIQGSISTRTEEGNESAEESLDERSKHRPKLLEWAVAMQTRYERKSIQGHNIVGMVPGSDPDLRDQFVILSAHHDHIGVAENQEVFRGADDDASGTTGVLELARAFQIGLLKPRRTIVFAAWGAEELGLLGSRYYSEHPLFPLNKTVAMIQLDMIGRNEQRSADSAAGIDAEKAEDNGNTVNIAGSTFSPDLKDWIEDSNRRIRLTLRYRYDSGQENLLKRSDQWGFLKARIPSAFFFTGFHPDYHKTTDTPDKINYQKMERILKLIYLTLWDVADHAQPPRFVSSLHAP